MRMDLHLHSTASDGVKSPVEVVEMAHKNGVEVMALTDHDTVAGLRQARKRAQELGIRFIDGVELSVTWSGKTIHQAAKERQEGQARTQAHPQEQGIRS